MTNHRGLRNARFRVFRTLVWVHLMQVLDPVNRVISLAHDNLPLGARFFVAGSIWDLKSNSQEILQAMQETFEPTQRAPNSRQICTCDSRLTLPSTMHRAGRSRILELWIICTMRRTVHATRC